MKKTKRLISAFITICMVMSLLPAQFASAVTTGNEDKSKYIFYGKDESALKDKSWKGNVLKLEKTDSTHYKMYVGFYNLTATTYMQDFKYDSSVVQLTYEDEDDGTMEVSSASDLAQVITKEKLTEAMLTSTGLSIFKANSGNLRSAATVITSDASKYPSLFSQSVFSTGMGGIILKKEDGTNYYKVHTEETVSSTDTAQGQGHMNYFNKAVTTYKEGGTNYYQYEPPADTVCYLYSLVFELKSGKELTADTFDIYWNDHDTNFKNWGGAGVLMKGSGTATLVDGSNEGLFLIGDFVAPEEQEQQDSTKTTVSFTVVNKETQSGIKDATVTLYNGETSVESGKTDENGLFEVANVDNTKTGYSYTVAADGYVTQTKVPITIGTSNPEPKVEMVPNSSVGQTTTITVYNADTAGYVEGAKIYIGGEEKGTTDSKGVCSIELTPTIYSLKVTKDGFTDYGPQNITINESGNAFTVRLVPTRATIELPVIQDGDGNTIDDTSATIKKTTTDNPTAEWSSNGTRVYGDDETIKLPTGNEYDITISGKGYTDTTIYVVVGDDGKYTYYEDAAHQTVLTPPIKLTKLTDPYYQVEITNVDREYTATVTVHNVKARYGTFGLSYDKSIFEKTGFEPETGRISILETGLNAAVSGVTESSGDDKIGYHVFTWGGNNDELDASGVDGTKIATYTFTLKSGKTADDIAANTFSVMPYDKTEAGQIIAAQAGDDTEAREEFLNNTWRYVSEGDEGNADEGHLPYSAAEIHGLNVGGFYQAFVYSTVTQSSFGGFYDIRTQIDFTYNKSGLTFTIIDKETQDPIENASIKIYDKEATILKDEIKTDASGVANYTFTSTGDAAEFSYVVSANGYWDEPSDGSKKEVTVQPLEAANETVELIKKIYHPTSLHDKNDDPVDEKVATLGGDKYAYYGKDYHFTIQPSTGYKFKDGAVNPERVLVIVNNDGIDKEITPEFDKESESFILDKDVIPSKPILSDEPTADGYLSNDIIVKYLDDFVVDNKTLQVSAYASSGGTVSYTADPATQWGTTSSATQEIVIRSIKPDDEAKEGRTGTFTFTPNETYEVEKVFINGVQVHNFDGKTTAFEYSFGNVDMDNNITVFFSQQGMSEAKNKESIITLAVGDYGTVNIENPDQTQPEDKSITKTRRVYYNLHKSNADLVFTASAVNNQYEVASVQVQTTRLVDGVAVTGERQTITAASNKYTVSPEEGTSKVVYVTFRRKASSGEDELKTPTVFVKSYVKEGEGEIKHTGILIYNKYDSPTFTANADTKAAYLSTGMYIAPLDTETEGQLYNFSPSAETNEYTLESLESDTALGAIFETPGYIITGVVDLGQGVNFSETNPKTGAKVTFERVDEEGTVLETVETVTLALRHNATFSQELSAGTWDVTVSKPGYVNYKITGFVVDPESDKNFGMVNGSMKPIVPLIGNTTESGRTVSLIDAANIQSGLRSGVKQELSDKANVDDSEDGLTVTDMNYVMFNYGRIRITQSYDDFISEN